MKISGLADVNELTVSEARPKTTYIVRFQDTGSGRMTVIDCVTDESGNAKMAAPIAWGRTGLKGSAAIVGEKAGSIQFTNDWADDGSLVMREVKPVPVPAFTPSPEKPPAS